MRILLFIYFFLFLSLIINKLYLYAILSLLIIPLAIYINKYRKESKVREYTKKIKRAKKAFKKKKHIEPFINVNEEPWNIIELIPGVTRVRAKIFANSVKKTQVKNFNEFANICNIEPALYSLVQTIVKF